MFTFLSSIAQVTEQEVREVKEKGEGYRGTESCGYGLLAYLRKVH